MNIAEMTDEELTAHVERLAKVVEEKNIFVGAILRAELDDFLRDLREGTREAQRDEFFLNGLRVSKDWTVAQRTAFRDHGENVMVTFDPKTQRQTVQVISPTHEHIEFDLPKNLCFVKEPKKEQLNVVTQGISVNVDPATVKRLHDEIAKASQVIGDMGRRPGQQFVTQQLNDHWTMLADGRIQWSGALVGTDPATSESINAGTFKDLEETQRRVKEQNKPISDEDIPF